MAKVYDYLIITHLPAFYKVNLYNKLAQKANICVIFLGKTSKIRTNDFINLQFNFDSHFLFSGDFEKRSSLLCLLRLLKIIYTIKFKKILLGGWENIEFWLPLLFINKHKVSLALESSIGESKVSGFKKVVKQAFLKRVDRVFASGSPHGRLLKALGYKGEINYTDGVGLFPLQQQKTAQKFGGKFLYIGRLAKEKNLLALVEVFNKLSQFHLSIVGNGPLESELKANANSNISFYSHVANDKIADIYKSHDVFVLPSNMEPWGLVVEEALYYGLPVIVSNKVGCAEDLVEKFNFGVIFSHKSSAQLQSQISWIASGENFANIQTKILQFDFTKRAQNQVNVYLDAVK